MSLLGDGDWNSLHRFVTSMYAQPPTSHQPVHAPVNSIASSLLDEEIFDPNPPELPSNTSGYEGIMIERGIGSRFTTYPNELDGATRTPYIDSYTIFVGPDSCADDYNISTAAHGDLSRSERRARAFENGLHNGLRTGAGHDFPHFNNRDLVLLRQARELTGLDTTDMDSAIAFRMAESPSAWGYAGTLFTVWLISALAVIQSSSRPN